MNNTIIEIINSLIKKWFRTNQVKCDNKEKLKSEFIENGYKNEDINKAIQLFFYSMEPEIGNKKQNNHIYNRVFSPSEKLNLSVKMQGLIKRLVILNIVYPKECETLISQIVANKNNGSNSSFNSGDI